MITSERQLVSTQAHLELLRKRLVEVDYCSEEQAGARLSPAECHRLINLLEGEIEEYQATKAMPVEALSIHSPADLLVAPIRYRIASGLTVEEFARRVGVAQRQIARYEALGYRNCSIPTFQKIIDKLGIRIEGRVEAA